MLFYLGTHAEGWLDWIRVPLFVSRRRLLRRRVLPIAAERWALDSGGFTELSMYGGWVIQPRQYIMEVRRYRDMIGLMDFAAIQDWMCEPEIIYKTKRTVKNHQELTVNNYLELMSIAPDVKWMPVVQGYLKHEYEACVELYEKKGVDLKKQKIVGVGSVCRRQAMEEARDIVQMLHGFDLKLHIFGMKSGGITMCKSYIVSCDSMAWCFSASKEPPLAGCLHDRCNNCPTYALNWRDKLLRSTE